LQIVINVARGLVVYPKTIEAQVQAELPFMATEEILMAAVSGGGDRQELHERIRRHSLAAAEQVKLQGRPNDLIERLKKDSAFGKTNWEQVLDPRRFVGRAPQQVEAFVKQVVEPIREHYRDNLLQTAELKV
jgi:adenylosuccinate lyase